MKALEQALPKLLKNGVVSPEKLNRYLPPLITISLVIACSYTLSQITWLLMPGEESAGSPPPINARPAQPLGKQAPDYRSVSNAHLFGTYQQTGVRPDATRDAPETRLNLVLRGVLATGTTSQASAIISIGKGGNEENYGIGDTVSGSILKEVLPDRVILERGGRFETLRMPEDFDNSLIQVAPSAAGNEMSSDTPAGDKTAGALLSDIRQQILKNPTSFGQYAIPIPYNENGKLRGYRLQPQGDRTLFDKMGLMENDVIVAVNGVELNNPSMGIKALRNLQQAKQIDLTVLRNGSEIPLHFEIP